MNRVQDASDRSYPPAPWDLSGFLWMGLFETDFAIQLPEGLRRALNPRWVVVTLVRYLQGTLRHDRTLDLIRAHLIQEPSSG
jgi:hypothetical protein